MQFGHRIDHIVIVVEDLVAAASDYTSLGFTVVRGGRHESWGTHNALIALADGCYLELIAFERRSIGSGRRISKQAYASRLRAAGRSPVESRVLAWQAAGEGLVDFALLPRAIEQDIRRAAEQGLKIAGPFPGSRTCPDGQRISWNLGIPDAYDLPFLCADVTARSLRVPSGAAQRHANGVTGVRDLVIAVADLEGSAARYAALLGTEPQPGCSRDLPDTQTAELPLGEAAIVLASLAGSGSPLHDHLAARGEGPYALRLRSSNNGAAGALDRARAHGAAIELVCE